MSGTDLWQAKPAKKIRKFPDFFPVSCGERFARDCAHLDRRRFNRYLFTDCANRKGQIENEAIGSAHYNPNFFRSFEACVRHANFECRERQIREVVNAVRACVRRTGETGRRVAWRNFRTRVRNPSRTIWCLPIGQEPSNPAQKKINSREQEKKCEPHFNATYPGQ